jgi:effector-binding domain-containing protein
MSRAYEIWIEPVAERSLAVLRERIATAELAQRLRPLYDRVYAQVQRGLIQPCGHNVLVLREGAPGHFDAEAGVEVAAGFAGAGDVLPSRTPAGSAARTVHWGAYPGLPAAHRAVLQWCEERGLARAGVSWEIYGDWCDDESQLRTDVYHLLAAPSS